MKRNPDQLAVELVPIIKKKGETPQLIVIKQFRPPVGKYMIELPAGLVDSKESVVDAALRELKEETGYTVTNRMTPLLTLLGTSC